MSDTLCRYNNTHVVKKSKLLEHEANCLDRLKRNDIKICPYDNNHKINAKLYEKHLEKCSSKPKIDPKIRKEMSAFIEKSKTNLNESPWNNPTKSSISNEWETTSESIEKAIIKTKQIIEEYKDNEFTEEDHIFLEAYI